LRAQFCGSLPRAGTPPCGRVRRLLERARRTPLSTYAENSKNVDQDSNRVNVYCAPSRPSPGRTDAAAGLAGRACRVRAHGRHRRDGAAKWEDGRQVAAGGACGVAASQFGVWDPPAWRWIARTGAGNKVIMSIAGHVSRYSHVRMEAKRRALDRRDRRTPARIRREAPEGGTAAESCDGPRAGGPDAKPG
jgi:hypothetical protein